MPEDQFKKFDEFTHAELAEIITGALGDIRAELLAEIDKLRAEIADVRKAVYGEHAL
ncbi:hypothetical protein D3C87_1929350 [compost metagenome]